MESNKNRLSSNQSVNIYGTSGDLDYDLNTEELSTSVDLWKIVQRILTTFEVIEPEDTNTDDTGTPNDTGDTGDTADTGDTTTEGSPDLYPVEISFKHGFDGANVINVAYDIPKTHKTVIFLFVWLIPRLEKVYFGGPLTMELSSRIPTLTMIH